MSSNVLIAETGRQTGSPSSRRLRREDRIPAVVYGLGMTPISVSVDRRDLRAALSGPSGVNTVLDLTVEGDADMLYQVVLNLGSNAVKYTPEGGRVTIGADSDNLTRSVVVTVSDTGLGIPPDALPKLFDKGFEQIRVIGEVVQDPKHDRLDEVVQRIALELGSRAPADTGAGELVEELAGGVVGLLEERFVDDREANDRNLQPAD